MVCYTFPETANYDGERVNEVVAPAGVVGTSSGRGIGNNIETSLNQGQDARVVTSVDQEGKFGTMLLTNQLPVGLHSSHGFQGNTSYKDCVDRANMYIVSSPESDREELDYDKVAFYGHDNFGFEKSYPDDLHNLNQSTKSVPIDSFERSIQKEHDEGGHIDDDLDGQLNPFCGGGVFDHGYESERSEDDDGGDDDEEDDDDELDDDDEVSSYCSNIQSCILDPPDGALLTTDFLMKICPFINQNTLFVVRISKNSRGLGLAVSGGIESTGPWPGLIRIKRIYPQTPAWLTGLLLEDDILLEANGRPLTGLTSNEALEVLRTTGNEVSLVLCRPPAGTLTNPEQNVFDRPVVTTSLTAPQPICGHHLTPSSSVSSYGEFEVRLSKVGGSLGFTLRKQDNSILGHTIRSLVREPALSDGRMRAGDKLLSVNGHDMCGLTHEEAVAFLRTCPEKVVIRLYRDALQTPLSPASPVDSGFPVPKQLRQEAMDMLSDLAFRRKTSLNNNKDDRRRRLNKDKTPSPDIKIARNDRWDSLVRDAESASPSEYPDYHHRDSSLYDDDSSNTVSPSSSRSGTLVSRNSSGTTNPRECSRNSSITSCNSSIQTRQRPNFLDLANISSCSYQPSNFGTHGLDGRLGQLPDSNQSISDPLGNSMGNQRNPMGESNHLSGYKSMDSEPHIVSSISDDPAFFNNTPAYRSMNLGKSLTEGSFDNLRNGGDNYTLLKWKGVVFTPDKESENDDDQEISFISSHPCESSDTSPDPSLLPQVLVIDLKRGWNSRLGFSIQSVQNRTLVVAVHDNSVAKRDGRLKVGDQLIKVNGEDVSEWPTEEIIDMLRKTRGKISLALLQQ